MIGIVIPVIGIAVTIWAAGGLSFGGGGGSGEAASGAARTPSRTLSATPGGSVPDLPRRTSPPADTPPQTPIGSAELVLEPGLSYLDLDAGPPMAMPSAAGADLVALFDARPPSLATEGPTTKVARLSQGFRTATPAECRAALAKYGSSQAVAATVGTRYCVATDEGHVAYLEVVLGVPIEPHVRVKATVWE
ncbi:hypothetical protein [Embleya sp. NPDC001921]